MRRKNIIGVATIVIAMSLLLVLLPLQVAYANKSNKSLQPISTPLPFLITAVPFTILPTPEPFVPPIFTFITPVGDSSPVVSISDANLAQALVEVTGVSSANQLTENVLASINGTLDLSNRKIETLQGIEYVKNVTHLYLNKNPIYSRSEIHRLVSLTNLEYLGIAAISISELPSSISSMTWLKHLDISANRLEYLPSSLSSLNLESLKCNYCFLNVAEGSDTLNTIKEAASSANYQYQLNKLSNMRATCQELGTVVITWDNMPHMQFDNGAKAVVKRFSISTPKVGDERGSWLESESADTTSYTFTGLDSTQTYSFDISVDYHIEGTEYNGKYIKNYQKVLYQPIPQDTPTPAPTATLEPTPTITVALTPSPTEVAQITVTPDSNLIQPSEDVGTTNSEGSSLLRTLLILVICLIAVVIVLALVLFLRLRTQSDKQSSNRG